MSKAPPPVPPANRSDKGTGENKTAAADMTENKDTPNPDQKGHQANSKQNTTHQGYQQDR
jgi:hypothetical protein